MAHFQTIINIRNSRDEIREKIKTLDLKVFKDQTFGPENEYSYRGLIGGIDALMTDISTLTQYENRFLKLSDYQERSNILTLLSNILSYIETPNNLYPQVENLKKALRNYNLRNFSENLVQFEQEIDETRKVKLELQEILQESKKVKENITEINESIDEIQFKTQESLGLAKEKFEEIDSELESFAKKTEEQSELNAKLDTIKTEANEHLDEIVEFKTEADGNKKLIDAFASKVQEREVKLVELEQRTSANVESLKKYEDERKKVLQEANQLIESAKQALGYKTAEGLSASFDTQYKKAKEGNILTWWMVGAIVSLICTLGLGIWVMEYIKEEWFMILGRVLLLPIPIAGAAFCANQYTKQKNIIEDYAYKLTIAKAIVGFSEQLKKNGNKVDDVEYTDYIQKALGEIHKDPLRSRKEERSISLKSNQFDQVVDLAKKIADLTKTSN